MSAERRVGVRLSRAQDVVGCVAVPGHSPADSWLACIFIYRRLRRELTILPPTGSSWIARRWHLYSQLHAARGPSSWRRNRSPVTVPRASGENPGQDDPDAAGVLD